MKILTFKMSYPDKKWPLYLEEVFGKELTEKFTVESRQTASSHEAKIELLDFSGSSKILDVLKSNEHVISAYIVEDNAIKKVIV
jgi:hypothetical protein